MSTKPTRVIVTERTHDFRSQVEGNALYWQCGLTIKEARRQLLIDHPHLDTAEIVFVPLAVGSRV